ncbi:MAG: hypothetical protein HY021_09580 [Burkholderiales bacterium]|nr:hypothetical protein [Burkholderiales bacterium]
MNALICSTARRGVAVGALLACAVVANAQDTPQAVRAPHYGDVLFRFFQERWFPAITSLMVSQHFERLTTHEDDSELLRGGLLLSYGQHREAGEIFERLIATRPALRDRAWFFLAKLRYQRGLLPEAEAALARIEQPLTGELEDDHALLQAQLLLARGAPAEAAQVLAASAQRPGRPTAASAFARFNRGIALLQSGDALGGRTELDKLGREPSASEEVRALRDKANLALGFAALRDEQPQAARDALQRVRLNGLQSNKALLGFGWAAVSLKQPKQALVPWLELAGRDASDAAVLEARIAVPYAYAELGARSEALARYEAAITAYDSERRALDEAIAALRNGSALAPLLAIDAEREPSTSLAIELPALPHGAQLAPVLAEHDVQEGLRNHADLRWFDRNLRDWTQSLGAFDDMLATRRAAYTQRLPQVLAQANDATKGLQALRQRRDALAADLANAEATADGEALATDTELAQSARLRRVQTALPALATEPDAAGFAERARRIAGALTWQLATAQPQRLWDTKKSLASIGSTLDQATQREAALAQAQRDEPARFERLAARIAALTQRVATLDPQVVALAREQRDALQDVIVAALVRSQERLAGYTTQARFALAQLQDSAPELATISDNATGDKGSRDARPN